MSDDTSPKIRTSKAHIKGSVAKLKGDWGIHDGFREVHDLLDPHDISTMPNHFTSTRIANELMKRSQHLTKHNSRLNNSNAKQQYHNKRAHKLISKAIRGQQPAPMTHLTRIQDNGQGKPRD